jgi:nicotinamide riboside kinase
MEHMEERTGKKIIALSGPESTGKTFLAHALAIQLGTTACEEYARIYLDELGRAYQLADLEEIARGQLTIEKQALSQSREFVVLDTDLLVIFLWAKIKYRHHFDWMEDRLRKQKDRLYLLCSPEIAWTPDPLRENPYDREEIFEVYRTELIRLGLEYRIVSGSGAARLESALRAIAEWK